MRIGLFAEVDANAAEGPAIWLASVAEALARQGIAVVVLLRARRLRGEVLAPVADLPGVTLVDPFASGWTDEAERPLLSVTRAATMLERLDGERSFDAILVRGTRAAAAVAARRRLRGRLAFYLTDFPQNAGAFGRWARFRLRRTVGAARLLLCQTPEIAAYLRRMLALPESLADATLSPMVADAAFALGPARPPRPEGALRLVYTGKFAPAWNTLEITGLPAALAERGMAAELHVAGDKFLSTPDARFPGRMRAALARPGVVWHGGLPRLQALELAASAHVGLSWRAPELDGSLELSTKLLEFGAVGLPVVCNPTPMHRRLLGEDYPAFATSWGEVLGALEQLRRDDAWRGAAAATRTLAEAHRLSAVGAALAASLRRVFR